ARAGATRLAAEPRAPWPGAATRDAQERRIVSSVTRARRWNDAPVGRPPARAAGASPVVIPRRGLDAAPLSFPQQQVWLHSQLAPDVPLYNEQVTIRYRGALEASSLAQAFSELLARHEAWRTVFVTEAGALRQRIQTPTMADMPVADLRHLPPEEREREAVRLGRSEEHTSELQSLTNLVCRLLLEKKKQRIYTTQSSHESP